MGYQKYKIFKTIVAIVLLACTGFSHPKSIRRPTNIDAWKSIKHVVVIVLENTSPTLAGSQPYLKELKRKGASLEQFYAITHPSQPNYIAMIAGDTLGVTSDKDYTLNKEHLGDVLEGAGETWKVYAEGYPGNCYLEHKLGYYVRKHVPFLSFLNVISQAERCRKIVPASEFKNDIDNNRLPTYSMYVPDMLNDGHDTGVAYADKWLKRTFKPYFDNPTIMRDTLFIVTFDEDDRFHFNRIYTVLLGDSVKPGFASGRRYNHYSMLRTIEDIFELDDLGRNDLFAEPIVDIWR